MPSLVYSPTETDPEFGGPLLLGLQRSLLAIYTDLAALTSPQKIAIWTDFTSGSPPRWSRDGDDGQTHGTHAPALAVAAVGAIDMHTSAGFTAAEQLSARLRMVAIYLLDNPKYLVNPAFDPTINVKPYTPTP